MLEIGLATESKQNEILTAASNTNTNVENILERTAKPTTVLSVKDGGVTTSNSSPKTIIELLASTENTSYLMKHTFVKPIPSNSTCTNPFTRSTIPDSYLSAYSYNNTLKGSRLYKDGILLTVCAGTQSASTTGSYYYTFRIYQANGYNDKGLPVYNLIGSAVNITSASSSYGCVVNFFRKGNKIGLLFAIRPSSSTDLTMTSTRLKMYQFDITTKSMTTGTVSLEGIEGLPTSSTFFFPTPKHGTINDINYGYLMYNIGTSSSYGKIKYRAEFNPDTTSIVFTGKYEDYSTATDSYPTDYDASPYVVTKVSYREDTDRLIYSTIRETNIAYGYNYSGINPATVVRITTLEGTSGTLAPIMLDGTPYAFFEMKTRIAIYKLNNSNNKYEYVDSISTTQFADVTSKYVSYGLNHLGMVVMYQRQVGGTYYNDYHYVDYTNEVRKMLGIGG